MECQEVFLIIFKIKRALKALVVIICIFWYNDVGIIAYGWLGSLSEGGVAYDYF